MSLADRALFANLLHRHPSGVDRLRARAGDPLDVVLAHLALEQAFGGAL